MSNLHCRYCAVRVARRAGLCLICHRARKLRLEGKLELEDDPHDEGKWVYIPAPLPEVPTAHLPGTIEKIAVLRGRFVRREELFHPDDVRA